MANVKRFPWLALVGTTICFVMSGCYSHNTDGSDSDSNSDVVASGSDPLLGEIYPRTNMRNPYGHITPRSAISRPPVAPRTPVSSATPMASSCSGWATTILRRDMSLWSATYN